MQTNELIEFARRWSRMNVAHIEQQVAQWEGRHGLLFMGPDERTTEAIEVMREYLQPDAVLRFSGQRKAQWHEETDFLLEKCRQQSLLEPSPSRVAIITEHLDQASEWMHLSLKAIFERAILPAVLLATATDERAISSYLPSHYHIFHARTRRRNASEVYKVLPHRPRTDPPENGDD